MTSGIFLINKARDKIYQLRVDILKLLSEDGFCIEEEIRQLHVRLYIFLNR